MYFCLFYCFLDYCPKDYHYKLTVVRPKALKSFSRLISSDARMERAASTMAGCVMEMLTAVTRVMSMLTSAPMKLLNIY